MVETRTEFYWGHNDSDTNMTAAQNGIAAMEAAGWAVRQFTTWAAADSWPGPVQQAAVVYERPRAS